MIHFEILKSLLKFAFTFLALSMSARRNSYQGNRSSYKVESSTPFYNNGEIELTANVGSFDGQKPGVSLSKRWCHPVNGKWFDSKKRFYMSVECWHALLNEADNITELADSLASSKLLSFLFNLRCVLLIMSCGCRSYRNLFELHSIP